jgi:folate-dependent phosphoribosylglycinamide formyltransferase PurN
MKIVITAGFDGSVPTLALCELLKRSGHYIDTVLVVTPFSLQRIRAMLKQRGIQGLKKAASKLLYQKKSGDELSLQKQFLLDNGINFTSLKKWCKANQVKRVFVKNLNSLGSIKRIKQSNPDVVLYAGGGILKSSFIEAAKYKIVNIHCGPLPEVRGMNAVEWSILLGYEPSTTIHMIDQGIDTGKIISRKKLLFTKGDTVESIRDQSVISGMLEVIRLFEDLSDLNDLIKEKNRGEALGRQCYILAPALRELLEKKLKSGIYD